MTVSTLRVQTTRWLARACSVAVIALSVGPAEADPPDEDFDPLAPDPCTDTPDECGRKAFEAGVQAFQAEDFPTALKRFRDAYRYKPHPAVALNLALAESRNGMLVEALARFDEVIGHAEASDRLKQTARQEREVVEGNVAVLVLEVEATGSLRATVDGKPMTGSPPTAKLNPGLHRIVVKEGDRTLLERTVTLALRERLRIAVQRASEVQVVAPPGVAPPPPRQGVEPAWFYTSAGLTVALGALTLWSGLDTRSAYDSYERDLPRLPQDEINQRVDDGNAKELRTNVLIGTTALAVAGTAVLGVWFVDWGGSPSEGARVGLTPSGLHVRGTF